MRTYPVIVALFACALAMGPYVLPARAQTGPDAVSPVFYLDENGTIAGPFPLEALAARVAAGTLGPSTLVWTSGQADWAAAVGIETLAGLFASADPDIDLPDFLIGRWVQEGAVPLPGGAEGVARITTDYRADQTFSLAGTIATATLPAPLTLSGEGVWSIESVDGASFEIALAGLLRMQGAEPPAASQLLNQQSQVEVVDANTLRNPVTGELLRRAAP